MVTTTGHDPIALFTFAVRENDWVLADLLARRLERSQPARLRRELAASARRPGYPGSLAQLRLFATLARDLGLGGDGA